MKKRRAIAFKLIFFCFLAFFIFQFCRPVVTFKKPPILAKKTSQQQNKRPSQGTRPTPELKVVRVRAQNLKVPVELPARLSAYKIAEIRPQVDGIIQERSFKEGAFVEAERQLYQIDPTIYQADYESAKANLETIKAKKDRYESLLAKKAISKQEFDDISAQFTQFEADVKTAKANLEYTKVHAPISGYIGKSNVTAGALVSANQSLVLATITQLDPIYADISVPVKDSMKFRSQDQSEFVVTLAIDGEKYQYDGILKFSEVFADEVTDSILMRAQFINPNRELLSGMFATAQIYIERFDVITIPQRVTNRDASGNLIVWVVDLQNQIMPRVITATESFNDQWIVTQGLEDGEVILYEGFQKIAPKMKIKPVEI